jgi:heat-inducible transcriptional repressor
MEIDTRQKEILRALIDLYVETAEPVGSKSLADRRQLGVSSATLRGEMAELEAMGYLEQPHTSAGRIPTPLGYRLYVDELMRRHRLSVLELEDLTRAMKRRISEFDRFAAEAGRALAQYTRYPTISLTATGGAFKAARFDLVPLPGNGYVCVVVGEDGQVHHATLRLPDGAGVDELRLLATALNAYATGIDLTGGLPAEIRAWPDIAEFVRGITQTAAREMHLSGGAHLLSQPEYHDALKAQRLLTYLSEDRAANSLPAPAATPLNRPVQIIIGPENAAAALADASVILASYALGSQMRGIIGLVGPTRMDYATLASKMESFASRLERLFLDEEENT